MRRARAGLCAAAVQRLRRGRFLVIEGPDGAGKSTAVNWLARRLRARGIAVRVARDPGGTAIGRRIRSILLDPRHCRMAPAAELFLYLASRAQLVAELIKPALTTGEVVIADRFTLSTIAYQGAAAIMPLAALRRMAMTSAGGLQPDHVILLNVPVETGLARLGHQPDRMERKGLMFLRRVRRLYRAEAARWPRQRLTVIDATRPLAAVQASIWRVVDGVL